ncbi:alpha/beta fold hydrolase [Actinomadura sp. NEAU-AAG7]|uniref:alpha/beta fold hydrolase n=1 Tax=Actinomadura sp. NEAU-AAG7 TaxID=2839640 RepID=UPI0035B0BFF9
MMRSRWMARGVAGLAAVAAGAGALGGSVAAAAPPGGAPWAAAAPQWGECAYGEPSPAECADIQVPLSWADPDGPKISLRLSRLPAQDREHRLGSMLFNPGGPGGPGAAVIALRGRQQMPADLQRRFDIVGFDPRGVGDSTPVTCAGAALSPDVAVFPRSKAQFTAIKRQSAAYGASCAAGSRPDLLAHVDTVSAARDMDAIRTALGEQRISFLGLSYGASSARPTPACTRAASGRWCSTARWTTRSARTRSSTRSPRRCRRCSASSPAGAARRRRARCTART